MAEHPYRTILIAGPTASGKSSLAVTLAAKHGGAVVNADSMQVYDGLSILTARPGPADLAQAPHIFYGHVDPATAYSTGAWLRDVTARWDELRARYPVLIVVGGTGLYFKALTGGLAEIPPVPAAIRTHWREMLAEVGPAHLHARLAERDSSMAARLLPNDGQRLVRALEVVEATGRSMADWQADGAAQALVNLDDPTVRALVLEPARKTLHERIAARFGTMIDTGAVEEARAFMERGLAPDLPSMKAIGLRELAEIEAFSPDAGNVRQAATERAIAATRQYAKRQSTWFRNQFDGRWNRVENATDAMLLLDL